MESRKAKLTRNSKSLKRLVTDFTEIKRPGLKHKHVADDSINDKCKTLPKNFKNMKIGAGTSTDVDKSIIKSFASDMEQTPCDAHNLIETTSIEAKLHNMNKQTTEIAKKVEQFGDTLRRKRVQSQQMQEEITLISNPSKSATFHKIVKNNEPCKKYIASDDDDASSDDMFGFNTFDEDKDDNYFVEAFNKNGQELVITTLEITRRTIDPHQFDDGIKDLIDNSDYVFHQNKYATNSSSSESDICEIVSGDETEHVMRSYEHSTLSNHSFLHHRSQQLVLEDEVFVDDIPYKPQVSSYYNYIGNNDKEAEEEGGETTNNFYENINYFAVCQEITYEEVDSINRTFSGNTSLDKKEKTYYIIEEMKKTEELYISGLKKVVENYMPYLYKHTPQDLIGRTAYLFGNIKDIYENAKLFLDLMRQNDDNVNTIAQIFISSVETFELYPLYSKNKPTADTYLKQFDVVVKERQRQLNDKLGLASYLLTPIQRLGKYVLLLEGIQKELKKTDKPSDGIKAAIDVIRNVMRKGNDYIAIDSIKDSTIDLTTKGSFIMRAAFGILKPRKFTSMVFLFENIVVFTEKSARNMEQFKYLESIPMSDLSLGKFEEKPNIFHLTNYTRSKRSQPDATYILEAETPKVKTEWTAVIEKILWSQLEKVKEQQKKISFTDKTHVLRPTPSKYQRERRHKISRTTAKPKSKFYAQHDS